jgi:hypothetical protein
MCYKSGQFYLLTTFYRDELLQGMGEREGFLRQAQAVGVTVHDGVSDQGSGSQR